MGSIPTYSRHKKALNIGAFCLFLELIITEKCCTKARDTFGIFERSRKAISLFGGKIFCPVCQLPQRGSLFGIVQAPPKSCPRLRGKCRGASRDERGTARRCQAVLAFPPSVSLRSTAPPQAVALLWRSANTAYSAVPLRGAIVSMGLRGSPGGLRGEIEIFPGPLAKKVIKLLAVLFACFTPSGCSFHSHPPPSTGRLFSIAKLRMCFPKYPANHRLVCLN